jgi:hypothetical protein
MNNKLLIFRKFMVFLQKVSFCNFIRNNLRLFSICWRKKIVIELSSFIYFFILLFYALFFDLNAKEVKINATEKNINKIFDKLKIKNLNSVVSFQSNYETEQNISYSNCGSDFPELPGNFPCSFLSDEFFTESLSVGSSPGGTVYVQKAKNKNTYGGNVFEVSSGEEEEFKLKLFYSKDGYLRAYTFKDMILLFLWVGKESRSLTEIFKLRINEKNEIKSIRRIRFDE